MRAWAIKGPDGVLLVGTIATSQMFAWATGELLRASPSKILERDGYLCVPVEITEAQPDERSGKDRRCRDTWTMSMIAMDGNRKGKDRRTVKGSRDDRKEK